MKRYSTSLLEKYKSKLQKSTHLTLVRMVIINKSTNNKCGRGYGKKGTLLHCCGNVNWYSHYGRHYASSSKNLEIRVAIWSSNPTPGQWPDKTVTPKDTCTPKFIAALFTVANTWKRPKCPSTDQQIKKVCYVYVCVYIYISHGIYGNITQL